MDEEAGRAAPPPRTPIKYPRVSNDKRRRVPGPGTHPPRYCYLVYHRGSGLPVGPSWELRQIGCQTQNPAGSTTTPPAVEADANESGTLLTLRVNRPRRTEGETTGGYETDGEREGTEKVPSMAEKARRRMDGSERSTRTPAVKSYRCPGAAVRPEWVSRGSDQSDEVDGRWWWASDARGWTVFNNSQRGG